MVDQKLLTNKHKSLLLSQQTFIKFGYHPEDLSFGSNKKIVHRCDVCGENKVSIYQDFVKKIGWAHNKCKGQKTRLTNIKKYGVINVFQRPDIQEKSRKSRIDRYGVDNINKLPEKKEKTRQTILKRYGVENPSQIPEVKEKKKKTFLKHFGVEHPQQDERIKNQQLQKRRQTWLQRRGVSCSIEEVDQAIIEYLQSQLQKEDYKLLSTEYVNMKTKLSIECPKGHYCEITLSDWESRGVRCSYCRNSKREKLLGEILEQIYPGQILYYSHPSFLEGLELDFCIESLNLGIEHDGEHHYKPVRYGGMAQKQAEENLEQQRERDKRKNALCEKQGYILVRIKYDEDLTMENVRAQIESAIKKGRRKW